MCKHLCRNRSCRFSSTVKGFTLIEVLCSISLFSLLSIAILTIHLTAFKIKSYNEKLNNYVCFMEEIKNNLIYNYSGDKIISLKNEGKCYIKKDDIKINALKENVLEDILSKNNPLEPLKPPYLEINVDEINTGVVNLEEDFNVETSVSDENKEVKNKENKYENKVKLLKINLKLNTDLKEKNSLIGCDFYKGTYKK